MYKKRLCYRIISLVIAVSCIAALGVTAVAAANPFKDVQKSEYYYDSVLWAVSEKITAGTSATSFSPNATCTRAQAVTFLWRCAGEPAPATSKNPFTDVKADSYYYKAVLWAVEKGITSGMTATTFAPDATVLREHFVTFLHRFAGKPAPKKACTFTDVAKDAYYADAVAWANENGYCNGISATKFGPKNSCTRGQTVTFLYRYDNGASKPAEKPDNSGTPEDPNVPDDPDVPSTPSTPSTPTIPGNPSNPDINKPQEGSGVGGKYETDRDYS